VVRWFWSFLTWLLWLWTRVFLKLGRVTRLDFFVRHRNPCGYNMKLVWVWAAAGAKCQQDPRNGTQCRVGPRWGRYGSIYQGLLRYFYVANVSFSCFSQGYIRVGKGHVGRKWDINVLLEKAERYLGGIKTWNWFYEDVFMKRSTGGTEERGRSNVSIWQCSMHWPLFWLMKVVSLFLPRHFHSLFTHEPISRRCEVLRTGSQVNP